MNCIVLNGMWPLTYFAEYNIHTWMFANILLYFVHYYHVFIQFSNSLFGVRYHGRQLWSKIEVQRDVRISNFRNMTSSEENDFNIRTNASPKLDSTRCPEELALRHSWNKIQYEKLILTFLYHKRNRESTGGIQSKKVSEDTASSGNLVSTIGTQRRAKPGVRNGKPSLLACHTHCKCFMETTHKSVIVKLGIKVMKWMKSLIGWEVTVSQGSKCHLTFVRGRLYIAE